MDSELKIAALFGSVIIGGVLVDLFRKQQHLKWLLSFSGGFLLTIIFTHVLPETYHELGYSTGYFILIGFLLQLILEYFSKGAEHGHTHVHETKNIVFPIAIFISLSLHAFIEAVPLDHKGHHHSDDLFWGVFMHKIPVAVALKTILKVSGFEGKKNWLYLLLFSLMAPAGFYFGEAIISFIKIEPDYILAIAVGMFLHISTTIIFESSEGHKLNLIKLVAIILGFVAGMILN